MLPAIEIDKEQHAKVKLGLRYAGTCLIPLGLILLLDAQTTFEVIKGMAMLGMGGLLQLTYTVILKVKP